MKIKTRELGVSIIICSYNGAQKIRPTLKALLNQKVNSNINWEIIFVDNNSTDNTIDIVKSELDLFKLKKIPFTIFTEQLKGKHYALNLGIKNAKFSYFIIVDDDNMLAENYVNTAYNEVHNQKSIGAIGCYAIATFENKSTTIPYWFIDNKHCYAIGEQGTPGDVSNRGYLWGAGMVSVTDLYEKMFFKYPSLLFNNGYEDIYIAEDTEYCMRLILKGYEIHYSPNLIIHHFVTNERLTYKYWQKLKSNIEKSYIIIDYYNALLKLNKPKYKSKFAKFRLKIISKFRSMLTTKTRKKHKNRILVSFLSINKNKDKNINILNSFINDKTIHNSNN